MASAWWRGSVRVPRLWLLSTRCSYSSREPDQPSKILKAAIIGAPNSGKSTLANYLVGQKAVRYTSSSPIVLLDLRNLDSLIFSVSPKVHTTKRKAVGVFTSGITQVVLLDTPGIIPYRYGRRLHLSKEFLTDAQNSLYEADTVMVMVDVMNKYHRERLPDEVIKILSQHSLPLVLVLNKIDRMKHKRLLLDIVHQISSTTSQGEEPVDNEEDLPLFPGKPTDKLQFKEIFMTSALTGDGVDDLKEYLLSIGKEGEWEYTEDKLTDLPIKTLVEDVIQEKLFLHLHKEIPYIIRQDNILWEESKDSTSVVIFQYLTCKSDNQKSIIIGPGGCTIQQITDEAQVDIERLLKKKVDLTLHVRYRKGFSNRILGTGGQESM